MVTTAMIIHIITTILPCIDTEHIPLIEQEIMTGVGVIIPEVPELEIDQGAEGLLLQRQIIRARVDRL